MDWIPLTQMDQLEAMSQSSSPVILYKHSTRCPVSRFIKKEFEIESVLIPTGTPIYLLDILRHRDLSNEIAKRWNIPHESPQVLLIKGKRCLYDASHNAVRVADLVIRITN